MFINKNSKLSVVDNTGTIRLRAILFYRNRSGYVGDLHVGSLNRVKTHRKFKKGQVFRAILVQTRRWTYRSLGSYVRSLAARAILIKKSEFMPLANRLNGFFFLELKNSGDFKFTSLTVYVVLALSMIPRPHFKSPKWSFRYMMAYDALENSFIRGDTLQFTPISSCTLNYSFYFEKRNVARAIYFVEKIFKLKPRLTFSGKRLNLRLRFSQRNFHKVFNLLVYLLNSEKKKIISRSYNEPASTITFTVTDLMSVFNINSPSFDYHSWNYATSIVLGFKDLNSMVRFQNFYILCVTKPPNF